MKKMSGFTILELMVTISVIGVISAIMAPPLMNIATKSRLMADVRTLQTVQKQIDFYKIENEGEFPGDITSVVQKDIEKRNCEITDKTWKVMKEKNYIDAKEVVNDSLVLQSKLKVKDKIKIWYSFEDEHIYMEFPKSIKGNQEDQKFIKIIKGLEGTKDEAWCKVEGGIKDVVAEVKKDGA